MAAAAEDYPLEQRLALAVHAGVDLLLFGNHLEYDPEIASRSVALLQDMVEKGVIPLERIRQSHARIMGVKDILR